MNACAFFVLYSAVSLKPGSFFEKKNIRSPGSVPGIMRGYSNCLGTSYHAIRSGHGVCRVTAEPWGTDVRRGGGGLPPWIRHWAACTCLLRILLHGRDDILQIDSLSDVWCIIGCSLLISPIEYDTGFLSYFNLTYSQHIRFFIPAPDCMPLWAAAAVEHRNISFLWWLSRTHVLYKPLKQ